MRARTALAGCALAALAGCTSVRGARLYRDAPAPEGFGAYSYVVFTSKPTQSDQARYERTCEAWASVFEPAFDLSVATDVMVTFWPLEKQPPAGTPAPRCPELVAGYDHGAGDELAGAVGMLGKRGPILVAWTKRFASGTNMGDGLVFDLSNVTDDVLKDVFQAWKGRLARSPAAWQQGFTLEKVKFNLKSFLEGRGKAVVAFIGHGPAS